MSPVVLRGRIVTLRPFRDDEIDVLLAIYGALPTDDGIHHQETPNRESVGSRVADSGTWSDGPAGLMLAIDAADRLVGEIQARGGRAQLLPPGVFELGIEVFDPAERGRGIGSAALVEITRYLFDEEDAHRVQLSTDVDNGPMRGAAARAGFLYEGVLRRFMPTREGPRDYAMFAVTRDDYEDGKGLWTSTG